MDKLLSTEQVGQTFGGRTRDWARRKANSGHFGPIVRDGGEVFVFESAIQAYITARVEHRAQVEAAATGNAIHDELHRRQRERRRQPKAS